VVAVGSRVERFRPGDAVFGALPSIGGGVCLRSRIVVAAEAGAHGFRTGGRATSGGRTTENHEGKVILTMVQPSSGLSLWRTVRDDSYRVTAWRLPGTQTGSKGNWLRKKAAPPGIGFAGYASRASRRHSTVSVTHRFL